MMDQTRTSPPEKRTILLSLLIGSELSQKIRDELSRDWSYVRLEGAHTQTAIREKVDVLLAREIERPWTPETLLTTALDEIASEKETKLDPVFVLTVACVEDIESIKAVWEEPATDAYHKNVAFYDKVLGKFLPQKFAEIRDWKHACHAYDVGTHATAIDDYPVYLAKLRKRSKQPVDGLATDLPTLDGALRGMSGVTLLGGLPGSGKTSLALHFVTAALRNHPDVAALYVQLDSGMTRTVMYHRLLCSAAKLPFRTLMGPYSQAIGERLVAAGGFLEQAVLPRLRIVERPQLDGAYESEPVDAAFLSKHRYALQGTTYASRMLVVVDYLGLIDVPEGMSSTSLDADDHRIHQIFEARRSNDTYLVIAEVNKAAGEVLTANDIKGSIAKQYGADRILLLEPDRHCDISASEVNVKLRIVKSRDGTERITIPLVFNHTDYTFRERAQATPVGPQPIPNEVGAGKIDPMAGLDEE